MGWEKGSGKLYYSKPRLVYVLCYAMLVYTMLVNTECQHATAPTAAVQTYNIGTGTAVLTVHRTHGVCVLWNSNFFIVVN